MAGHAPENESEILALSELINHMASNGLTFARELLEASPLGTYIARKGGLSQESVFKRCFEVFWLYGKEPEI
jgi:hypothetical protein